MSRHTPVRIAAVAGLLASLLFCTGTTVAQELADNPQYKAWARHKPGTSVAHTMKTSSGGISPSTAWSAAKMAGPSGR